MFYRIMKIDLKSNMRLLLYQSRRNTSKKYSNTLNLPKTSFPLSMKDGMAQSREQSIQSEDRFVNLYDWQSTQNRDKKFVLHDGPPYANGKPHVGHALNKILKDICNRYRVLTGHSVHYIPGWDCHGVPIEQKALAELKTDFTSMEPLAIRKAAHKFADKAIYGQKRAFKKYGVMADWSKCYYSFNSSFEADQLEVFYKMYEKGLIYQDYMPVYWSPSSGTALAESELEYKEDHTSTAVYVRFPIVHLPNNVQHQLSMAEKKYKCFAVIWTTTPWTLPANEAICYSNNINYCFVRRGSSREVYLICADFMEKLSQILGDRLEVLLTCKGSDLKHTKYRNYIRGKHGLPFHQAPHVTTDKGTGLVHTAPAHGPEDFQVAVNNNMSVICEVDERGIYAASMGPYLAGKVVLECGNKAVLEIIREHILFQEPYVHRYPYDWRTKQPVIIRASKQWFVNTRKVKDRAMQCLDDVSIHPASSIQGMLSQLDLRTYWCISRQRSWGVPIPVFYETDTERPLLSRASTDHLKTLFQKHGSDCWWSLSNQDLLPNHVISKSGFTSSERFERGYDVLDIWFDSGSSWNSVLKDVGHTSDVYLEGLDQFGGWFLSSLITSVAVQDKAPYKSLVVHGFAVDEDGRKMSKSIGNVVDPKTVILGGKDRKADPSYGTDVLRWWAAQSGLSPTVNIGSTVLSRANETIFKIRKSLRYMLGNTHDFEVETDEMMYDKLCPQDQYMLHLLAEFSTQVKSAYEEFNFSKIVNSIETFNNTHVSNFCHITKDRMYCNHVHDASRRSSQTVQYHITDVLTKALAPVLPHLAEEVYLYHPFDTVSESIFHTEWKEVPSEWHNPSLSNTFDIALSIRDTFNKAIQADNPVQFDVVVCCKPKLFQQLRQLQPENTSSQSSLTELLQCSKSSVLSKPPPVIPDESQTVEGTCQMVLPDGTVEPSSFLLVILPAEDFICERCRRHTAEFHSQPCDRCMEVMARGWEQ